MGSWRDRAAPIIAEVIRSVGREDEKALRRALRDAYPFGERTHWPYQIWLDEVAKQTGRKVRRGPSWNSKALPPDARQLELA